MFNSVCRMLFSNVEILYINASYSRKIMSLLQTMVLEKYVPIAGKTYYLYRNFSGKLFVTDDAIITGEKISSYVWSNITS